jgi:hypothetical protein
VIRVAILEYLKGYNTKPEPPVPPLTVEHIELVAKWLETQRTDIPAYGHELAGGLRYVGVEGILNGGIQSGKGWAVGVTKNNKDTSK